MCFSLLVCWYNELHWLTWKCWTNLAFVEQTLLVSIYFPFDTLLDSVYLYFLKIYLLFFLLLCLCGFVNRVLLVSQNDFGIISLPLLYCEEICVKLILLSEVFDSAHQWSHLGLEYSLWGGFKLNFYSSVHIKLFKCLLLCEWTLVICVFREKFLFHASYQIHYVPPLSFKICSISSNGVIFIPNIYNFCVYSPPQSFLVLSGYRFLSTLISVK